MQGLGHRALSNAAPERWKIQGSLSTGGSKQTLLCIVTSNAYVI